MLRERLDPLKRLIASRAFPVGEQLLAVQFGPFRDERVRAAWERAGDHGSVEGDGRRDAGVARVEVGLRVNALVPVHEDGDAVKEADPGDRRDASSWSGGAGAATDGRAGAAGQRLTVVPTVLITKASGNRDASRCTAFQPVQ